MSKLPKKFPEYSIMYKTISKQIAQLENQRADSKNNEDIDAKIESYKKELEKIRKMFPEHFFDDHDRNHIDAHDHLIPSILPPSHLEFLANRQLVVLVDRNPNLPHKDLGHVQLFQDLHLADYPLIVLVHS